MVATEIAKQEKNIRYHTIETIQDDYLEGFLDRFQDDFPPDEQMYVSDFLRALKAREKQAREKQAREKSGPEQAGLTLLCLLEESEKEKREENREEDREEDREENREESDPSEPDESAGEIVNELAGIACYEIDAENGIAFLWYLSVDPNRRSAGLGSRFYQEIVRRVQAEAPGSRYLLYEIERPDQAPTPEQAAFAERRIQFYRRNGGQLCRNLTYRQRVRQEPTVMMYLVAHAFSPEDRTPGRILSAVKSGFGNSIEPVEALVLE